MCNNEVLQKRLIRTAEFGELLARVHHRKGNKAKVRELIIQSYIIRREVAAMKAQPSKPRCGNIGEPIRHIELPGEEPLTVPDFPEEAPAETPAPVEPEKVPA